MEGTLNLLWLLTAVVAVVAWRARWLRPWRRYTPCGAVALACALVLLFPVISLTDDLHGEQAVMEESSRSALKVRDAAQRCLNAGKHTIHFAAPVCPGAYGVVWIVLGKTTSPEVSLLRWALDYPSQGRSPPSVHS